VHVKPKLLGWLVVLGLWAALCEPGLCAEAPVPSSDAGAAEETRAPELLFSSETLPSWRNSAGVEGIPWGRLLYGTTVVVALVCFGVYALKWLNGGAPLGRGRYMEVLEARPIGQKVQLFLVKVAGHVVMIACRGETVTKVAEFGEDDLPEPEPATPKRATQRFKSVLRHFARRQS
jgi:flagellar biogenesis protein FliO